MLRTIGPGLVCKAILAHGFTCNQEDFDGAHFSNADGSISLHCTLQILQDPSTPVGSNADWRFLDADLQALAQELVQDGAWFSLPVGSDPAMAIFQRIDKPVCAGRTSAYMVTVRAYRH